MEGYRKEYSAFQWSFFNSTRFRKPIGLGYVLLSSENSESDDSSFSSSSSSSDSETVKHSTQDAVMYKTQCTFACCTRIQHVMLACDNTTQPIMGDVHFQSSLWSAFAFFFSCIAERAQSIVGLLSGVSKAT